jgi:hypothetical protein
MTSMTRYVSVLMLVAVTSCGADDGGGSPDAPGGSATCTVTASALANTSARTIAGKGEVTCDVGATIALEVCVQYNPSGTFMDIMCQSSTQSGAGAGTPFTVTNTSSCGVGTGRMYRARVNATINGTAKPEVLSSVVMCE